MAGNSKRKGAVRGKDKKGPTAGSGGNRRRALEGRGPTPKAEDRPHHPAHRRAAKKAAPAPVTARIDPSAMIAGRNAVLEALRGGVPVRTLYLAHRIDDDARTRQIVHMARDAKASMVEVPRSELDRISDGAVHQGVVMQVPPYEYAHPRDLLNGDGIPLIVALDGVTDPRNLGAVLRSAAAFGARGVVIPQRRSAGMTASAWKASAGAAARIPVARAVNLSRALEDYRDQGLFIVGLDAQGESTINETDLLSGPVVLVIGSEGKGLSRLVGERCDVVASIQMWDETESLNAGVAAGIALYETARQRQGE